MTTTDFMNPTAAKIVLSAQCGDSINRISNKIETSYSWVYDWIDRLDAKDIISNTDNGVRVRDYEMRRRYEEMMGALYTRGDVSQEDAYVIPHFAGMEFAYTEIDAAYVWTHGGFQIARSHDDYPMFIEVHGRDVDRWIEFLSGSGSTRPSVSARTQRMSTGAFTTSCSRRQRTSTSSGSTSTRCTGHSTTCNVA